MTTATDTEAIRIIELRVENVKRIKAVNIRPEGAVIEITGKNGQGKSSILDAIQYALGGKDGHAPKPVREGEDGANVVLDLGEMIVTRTWNANGNTYLHITNKEGTKFTGPQAMLDKLVGELTFDPLAFSRMKPKEQASTIRVIAGLDFTSIEEKRLNYYNERTNVNRDLKNAEALVKQLPRHPDAPKELVSISEVAKELEQARETNRKNDEERRKESDYLANVHKAKAEVERLQQALNSAEATLEEMRNEYKAQARIATALQNVDIEPLEQKLADVETINEKVRKNQQVAEAEANLKKTKAKSDQLTKQIEELDAEKQRLLEEANLPIPGLSLSDDGVTLNGLPFEQACSSEQLKVSAAMGFALNPKLRVMLVRDGSLLDSEGRQIIADMAEKAGAQVWIERATDGEPIGIVIEDGELKQIPVTAEA